MQLRHPTRLTGEQYVTVQAWRSAKPERCPNHPHGGCSFARHGTYTRKTPRGICVARWYCPQSKTTFSLLPDSLAARLPGTLDALETVVAQAERSQSLTAAANELRRDAIDLPGAIRWVRRRVQLVHRLMASIACYSACVSDADRRSSPLTLLGSKGARFRAEQQPLTLRNGYRPILRLLDFLRV